MDLGLDEGSIGEPKGFLGVDWRRVLMLSLYELFSWGESKVGLRRTEKLFSSHARHEYFCSEVELATHLIRLALVVDGSQSRLAVC